MNICLYAACIFTLILTTASKSITMPIVGRGHAISKVVALDNTGVGVTLPLYFGSPIQTNPDASFIIDTTYTDILVATTDCGD